MDLIAKRRLLIMSNSTANNKLKVRDKNKKNRYQ